jgi:hypothetical protein
MFWQTSVFIISYSRRLFSETPFASLCAPTRRLTMELRNGIQTLDAYRPTFDPHLDIATVVFSHVQCVKTRLNLALVSKLWRDASKPAAAYPLRFDFDAFPHMAAGFSALTTRHTRVTGLLDNDEALSLPYERVVGLLGETARFVCNTAASRGSVRLLKWTRENNCDWSTDTCLHAAQKGHLPALQYLHENGCPWNESSCSYAAANGHLPALQYLHENGCPWNKYTCNSAAGNGQLPALQYLHENGCPWYSYTCYCAAGNGHLPALKYLHENGCPWDSDTCHYAAQEKRWDCLQYAVDNKCPMWEEYAKTYANHLTDEMLSS